MCPAPCVPKFAAADLCLNSIQIFLENLQPRLVGEGAQRMRPHVDHALCACHRAGGTGDEGVPGHHCDVVQDHNVVEAAYGVSFHMT